MFPQNSYNILSTYIQDWYFWLTQPHLYNPYGPLYCVPILPVHFYSLGVYFLPLLLLEISLQVYCKPHLRFEDTSFLFILVSFSDWT